MIFASEGVRVQNDFRNEKLGFKIREAQLQKVPYMLVIGERRSGAGTVDAAPSDRQKS